MFAEELVEKIINECRYTGTSKNDSYLYYAAIGQAVDVVKRELPAKPVEDMKAVTMSKQAAKDLRKKASEEEF